MLKKALVAEFIGTFALVFAGTGAIIIDSITGNVDDLGIAASFGLAVGMMVYVFMHISGAHFNPAVTIGFYYSKNIQRRIVAPYILSQILGATTASTLLYVIFGNTANLGATIPNGHWTTSVILEIIMTFFLMFVIINVATNDNAKPGISGVAIGGTVALNAFFGGPISGASMNPARSIGPAIISGIHEFQWVYILAPIIGALIAIPTHNFLKKEKAAKQFIKQTFNKTKLHSHERLR